MGRWTNAGERGEEFKGFDDGGMSFSSAEEVKGTGATAGEKDIQHAVAHCYKCGAVIELMLKAQWFIDVERLAKGAIERLEKGEIKFYPANKKKC